LFKHYVKWLLFSFLYILHPQQILDGVVLIAAADFTGNADRNSKIQSQKHFSPCICTSNSTTADRSVDQLILPRATPSSRRPLADLDVTSATTTLTKIKKMDTYNHTQARTPVQNDTVKRKRFKFNKFSKIWFFFSKIETFFTRLLYSFTCSLF